MLFFFGEGVLLSLKFSSPFVLLTLMLAVLRSQLSLSLITSLTVEINLFELFLELASLHKVVLSAFTLLKNLVTNAFLGGIGFGNIFHSMMVLRGCVQVFLVLLLAVRISKVRLNVVEIVHLFAFVVL